VVLAAVLAEDLNGELGIEDGFAVVAKFRLNCAEVGVGGGEFLECGERDGLPLVLVGEVFVLEFLGDLEVVETAAVLAPPAWPDGYFSYRQARLLNTAICISDSRSFSYTLPRTRYSLISRCRSFSERMLSLVGAIPMLAVDCWSRCSNPATSDIYYNREAITVSPVGKQAEGG
jgi:hypothetical protein